MSVVDPWELQKLRIKAALDQMLICEKAQIAQLMRDLELPELDRIFHLDSPPAKRFHSVTAHGISTLPHRREGSKIKGYGACVGVS